MHLRTGRTPSRSKGSRVRESCRRRGTRATGHACAATAWSSACVLPVQPGGKCSIESTDPTSRGEPRAISAVRSVLRSSTTRISRFG